MNHVPNFNMNTPKEVISHRFEMVKSKEKGDKIVDVLNRYDISRPVFYKFYSRYTEYGIKGLHDLSKAPHKHGRKTPFEKEVYLSRLYRQYPFFSSYEYNELVDIPPSTIQRIIKRNKFVKIYKPKREKKLILEKLKRVILKEKREKKSKGEF